MDNIGTSISLRKYDLENIVESSQFVKFFLFAFMNFFISLFFLIMVQIYNRFLGAHYENLIDLASICNISMLISMNEN